jgi:predicted CoA-binding protein
VHPRGTDENEEREDAMSSKAAIEAFVSQPALALIGISRSGKKFGNVAYRVLNSKCYRVYPIHPHAKMINGVQCYSDFTALPEPVQNVLVVLPPSQAVTAVRKAANAGIHSVWLQQGSESLEVLKTCRDVGVDAISGECILMFARPTSYHKVHRWVSGLMGKLPA